MSEVTVTIDDVAIPAEKLLDALDKADEQLDGYDQDQDHDAVGVDGVVLQDDGHHDNDVYVYAADGTTSFHSRDWLRREAEQQLDESFEDYLRSEVLTAGFYIYKEASSGDIKVCDYGDGEGVILEEALQNAVADEGVELTKISGGWLHLTDVRGE